MRQCAENVVQALASFLVLVAQPISDPRVGSNTKQYHDSVTGSRRHFTEPDAAADALKSAAVQTPDPIAMPTHGMAVITERVSESAESRCVFRDFQGFAKALAFESPC